MCQTKSYYQAIYDEGKHCVYLCVSVRVWNFQSAQDPHGNYGLGLSLWEEACPEAVPGDGT